MLLEEIFFEIGAIIIIAAVISMLAHRFRQPLIIAYILAGLLIGPSVFALTRSSEFFDVMAEFGVAFLLFTVGLGLNWRSLREVGWIALGAGTVQVLFSMLLGFLLSQYFDFDFITSLYLSIAFAFSSTIVVVKLLMDKNDLDTLYGRISVGFLLIQDFIAMFVLLSLGSLSTGAGAVDIITQSLFKALIVIPVLWFTSVKIVPPLVRYAARSQELLFIFSLAWCFLITGGFVWAGFGVELGALIAGVTLSGTLYQREISARIRPLRDFFLVIFFIKLGTNLGLETLGVSILPIIAFSLIILLSKPLIVLLIMRLTGYHPRTGFLAGSAIAQISEFSFIVLAAGMSLGHISNDTMVLATSVALITISVSSYTIVHNETIYEKIQAFFQWFAPQKTHPAERKRLPASAKIILFGYEDIGQQILPSLKKMKLAYAIVDFDPQTVHELERKNEPVIYGDAGDDNFLTEIQADQARLIISTIPDAVISLELLAFLKAHDYRGTAIVATHNVAEAHKCYQAGATYVIVPRILTGERLKQLFKDKRALKTQWKRLAADEQQFLSRVK
ncbi:cation:proton antiporter [Patescibacteria group bacterium]|nr:cation:proton antiporter [Patescibacteria group bacterium]MBU1705933.1 cation:proton antiporter [Patescibacteria group bacterium]